MLKIELIIGNWYKVRSDVKTDGTMGRPIKYTGLILFDGEYYHNFWEPRSQLHYFINPDEVEQHQSENKE